MNNMKDPYELIHSHPQILCFDVPFDGTYGTLVKCSTNINEVTCTKCNYYYYHPEARLLEIEFRIKNSKNN